MRKQYLIQTRISPSHPWEDEPNGGNLPTLDEAKRVARAWLNLESKYEGNIRIIEIGGAKHVAWSGTPITGISPPTKPPQMKTFRNVPVHDLLSTMDATDQSDSDENPAMLDYSGETARSFCREWIGDTFDLEEVSRDEIENAIQEAVSQAIDENVSRSMFKKVLNSTADALDKSFEQANVGHEITVNEKRGTLNISVVPDDIVRAWREEITGTGLVSLGGDESIEDIRSPTELIGILDSRARVYGHPSLKSLYNDDFDRFEPDTGTYADLAKVAENAWKKHRREKHKAGTKHRR